MIFFRESVREDMDSLKFINPGFAISIESKILELLSSFFNSSQISRGFLTFLLILKQY